MTYTIQYLSDDGEWCSSHYMRRVCAENNLLWVCVDLCRHAEAVESYAASLSGTSEYTNVPIRTLYGESLSPVSVYVNGYNVRDAWVDRDLGHPHLQVTV